MTLPEGWGWCCCREWQRTRIGRAAQCSGPCTCSAAAALVRPAATALSPPSTTLRPPPPQPPTPLLQRAAVMWMQMREGEAPPQPHPTIAAFCCAQVAPGGAACFVGGARQPGLPFWIDTADGTRWVEEPPQWRLLDFKGGLFCDEPGLGKTITGVRSPRRQHAAPVLLLCAQQGRVVWRTDIERAVGVLTLYRRQGCCSALRCVGWPGFSARLCSLRRCPAACPRSPAADCAAAAQPGSAASRAPRGGGGVGAAREGGVLPPASGGSCHSFQADAEEQRGQPAQFAAHAQQLWGSGRGRGGGRGGRRRGRGAGCQAAQARQQC